MRRVVIALLLVLIASFVPRVGGSDAQPAKPARIGVLSGNLSKNDACLARLRRGMSDLGHVEGRTHVLEVRWSETQNEAFPRLAAELVAQKPDVIVNLASASIPAIMRATSSIPIVMASSVYPMEQGFIASLARPGGNVTGMAVFTPDLIRKRVQILKEALPTLTRLVVLRTDGAGQELMVNDIEAVARQLDIRAQVIAVRRADDIPTAFETAMRAHAQAVMTTQSPFFGSYATQIAALALKHRVPSLSGESAAAEAGMLLFHGPYVWDACHRAARYVERILKGAKPSELPVEQPTKVELVVNLKTAHALGLIIPPSVLARADRVIE